MTGCANAFLQPIGRYLLVLWYRINQQESETYYINLLTLTNFKALPNAILRLQFNCNTNRVLRSESLSIYNYMNRFSIKNENVELLDVVLELKFKDLNHYPWLINFLKSVKQNRKVSTNSTIQVPSSQVKEVGTPLRLEKRKFSSVNPLESDLTSTPKKIMKIGGKKVRSATLPEFTCVMTPEQTVTSDQVTDSVDEIEDSSVNSTHSQIHKTEVDISSEKLFVEDESFEATNISSEIGSISDSFKLFSSKIIDKLKLLEFNILERKNQLQAELDLHFAEIEAKQKRKVKQIHEYVVEELNKMK
ncbi:hypothetical protein G210_2002 [Candida maltosa Xu316]|uniref:Uncharacterized protein n=1 Tax=Candida maltosa (strain Xu316) TaxID=1245528 RepID=M3JXE4_CANMX|nr:hypothetical protein G210_2002 [Candida maltosa Xu316]